MGDPQTDVVEELESHSETLGLRDFVRTVEKHHREDEPGVERELLADYADAVYFDVESSAFEDRLTANEEWTAGEKLYEVADGRISAYPASWHETISETDGVRKIIELIQSDVTEPEGDAREAVTEEGVPEEKVLRVAETVAGIDRADTREQISALRKSGEIEEFASQHRNPRLHLG